MNECLPDGKICETNSGVTGAAKDCVNSVGDYACTCNPEFKVSTDGHKCDGKNTGADAE